MGNFSKEYMKKIALFILGFSILGRVQADADSIEQKPRVAVCYWGLTRSASKVYQTHFDNIFNVLKKNNVFYDVFMHTWTLKGPQYAFWNALTAPIDYDEYMLLKPKYFRRDDQDLFTEGIDFSLYYYESEKDKEWHPRLVFNLLCGLESQKRVTSMVYESGNEYDYIIYVRPDVRIDSTFDVSWLNLPANGIVIPDYEHYEGYNDRFAILPYANASVYANRIDQMAEFRKNHGRIVSEKYLKYVCDTNNLIINFVPFLFKIIRPNKFLEEIIRSYRRTLSPLGDAYYGQRIMAELANIL